MRGVKEEGKPCLMQIRVRVGGRKDIWIMCTEEFNRNSFGYTHRDVKNRK